jgi:long-chain acyl-CoA synthetase|eukprot:g3034.t1
MRDLYDRSFSKYGKMDFLVYEKERYSFGKVQKICGALSAYLVKEVGVKKGDRVAVAMRNYVEWPMSYIATTGIGAVCVPLNSLWKERELEYGLRDSGTTVLICDQERYEYSKKAIRDLGIVAVVVRSTRVVPGVVLFKDVISKHYGSVMPLNTASHNDIAAIMYTSGTTGFPKGVVHTHRNITNQMSRVLLGQAVRPRPKSAPQDCRICPVPLFHVTASHHIFLDSLVRGSRLVLMYKWDAGKALKLIQDERPSSWTGVPTMVQDIMEHPEFDQYDTSSLKSIGGGGGPTPTSQVAKTAKKFKGGVPTQGYGLTETNGGVTGIGGEEYMSHPTSCGKPGPCVEACIIDVDAGASATGELPRNSVGELLIKGPLVMSHYWNKREKTDDTIITVPGKGHGWFRTGDIARIDDEGYIYIMDRAKDLIIRGGENISCAEVEAAFFSHDKVMELCAFAIKDDRLGERVGVMLVPKKGQTLSQPELLRHVEGKIAAFKIPKPEDMFFQSEILPRGATGKILKRVVRDKVNETLAKAKQGRM